MSDAPVKENPALDKQRRILAPNVLLYGPPGSGKSTVLSTALDISDTAQLFVIHTEAPGVSALGHLDPERYHYTYIPPVVDSWSDMLAEARDLSNFPWEVMKEKTSDTRKKGYTGYYRIIKACSNFVCDHCGKEFGDVSAFPEDWTFALDSLSGLNEHSLQGTIGKPIAMSLPQWGVAMKTELNFLNKLLLETRGPFVLTAHVSRYIHEISGQMIVRPAALGQANAPEIPKNFTDIIYTRQEAGKFWWSTTEAKADLKPVNVPISDKIPPDLSKLYKRWAERTKAMRGV